MGLLDSGRGLAHSCAHIITRPLWLLGVFAPSLVALTLTAQNEGAAAVRALVGRIFQWQVSARWCLFAVSHMAAIKLAPALAHRMTAGSWPQFGHERSVVILVGILVSTPVEFLFNTSPALAAAS